MKNQHNICRLSRFFTDRSAKRFIYGASKAAVIGMMKSIAADFITQGLRANAICPGTVESPSWHERVRSQATNEKE